MELVVVGVDPHKLSATIEVVDEHEKLLGSGRFTPARCRETPPLIAWRDVTLGSYRLQPPSGAGGLASIFRRVVEIGSRRGLSWC